MTTNRYNKSRNEWRKSYGFSRRKPVIKLFYDAVTGISYSADLNHLYRDRDYYLRDKLHGTVLSGSIPDPGPPVTIGEYDEGIVWFDGSSPQETGSFNFTFSSNPIVVFSLEEDPEVNVNLFGLSRTTSGFAVGASAPFSGAVRYRAIYSTGYPAECTSPYSGTFFASANTATLSSQDSFDATFDYEPFVGPVSEVRTSAWNTSPNNEGDVHVQLDSFTESPPEVSGSLTADTTADIHFIVYY